MLNHSRYAGILCAPVKTKTILYNPFLMGEVAKARNLLKEATGVFSSKELVEKVSHSSSDDEPAGTAGQWKDWISDLTMTPVSIPPFHRSEDYEQFIQKHRLLLTEIFSPEWNRFLGSSRHLLAGHVQMKGTGLSLPVQNYQYMNGSGVYGLSLALKSFIYSGLMDTSVPLGSGHAIAVQWAPWSSAENPMGIYLRELRIPRMIQVGRELTEAELKSIRDSIGKKLGVNSARDFAELLTAQLASMVIIGGRANCSPDNILVDGQFIDEETWHWPLQLDSRKISFEFECEKGKFDWKSAKFAMSTCLHMKNSLEDLQKFLGLLYGENVPSVKEMEKLFYSQFDFDMTVWNRALELGGKSDNEDIQKWFTELENEGWTHTTEYFKDQGMAFHFTKARKESGELADRFNRQPRPDFLKVAVKLSKLDPGEVDADELSNNVQSQIGASGFVLPFRFVRGRGLVKNSLNMQEFIELTFLKWPVLKKKKLDMIVWDGNSELTLKNVTAATKLERSCIPLSFHVHGMSEKTYVLPCPKTVLTAG